MTLLVPELIFRFNSKSEKTLQHIKQTAALGHLEEILPIENKLRIWIQ